MIPKSSERKLACVMFTDIVGYTSLMGEDETKALEILQKNRDIQLAVIENYGGVWIKELGDGTLATFDDASNAVMAAISMQHLVDQEGTFQLRIGLHHSEVIFEDGDVFGDGVNIASRIQSVADNGSILISSVVHDNLKPNKEFGTKYHGEQSLKNVKDAIRLFEVFKEDAFQGVNFPIISNRVLKQKFVQPSIAVLPFRNLSLDPEQDFLCEGISEEIIVTLSNIKNLKVVGRRSSFQFNSDVSPIADIAKALNVNRILEGSVRKHGTGIRIHAELINVEDGCQLWAERFDRDLSDIFIIQDEIADKIANNLKLTFNNDNNRTLPVNMQAYEMVLKGRYYVERFLEGFDKAMSCFSRAIDLDPKYAEGYAELGKLYFLLTTQLMYSPKEGFERAKFYAEKALELNDELAAAHYLLGQLNMWYFWDFAEAKIEFETAHKCSVPSYFTGIVYDPWFPGMIEGDWNRSINSTLKILDTDPLNIFNLLYLGYIYVYGGKFEEGRGVFNQILNAVPNFSESNRMIAMSYSFEGQNELAYDYAKKAAAASSNVGWAQNFLLISMAKLGMREETLKLLAAYENNAGPLNVSKVGISIIYIHLNDHEKALDYIEKGIEERDVWSFSLGHSREYDLLRDHPRFIKLIEKMNYPPVSKKAN